LKKLDQSQPNSYKVSSRILRSLEIQSIHRAQSEADSVSTPQECASHKPKL